MGDHLVQHYQHNQAVGSFDLDKKLSLGNISPEGRTKLFQTIYHPSCNPRIHELLSE